MISRVIRLAKLSGSPIYFLAPQVLETSTREATFSRDRAPKLRRKVVVRQADLHARRTTERITRFAGLRWYRPFNQACLSMEGNRSSPYPDRNATRNSRVSTFRFDWRREEPSNRPIICGTARLDEYEFQGIASNFRGARQNRDCDASVNHRA